MRIFFLILLLAPNLSFGQQVDLPNFNAMCRTHQIEFPTSEDSKLKFEDGTRRFHQDFDIRIEHSKADYSVLAYFYPIVLGSEEDPPAVLSMLRASHFATNDTTAVIAAHRIDDLHVRETYGADWGRIYYFQPKQGIEDYKECQLVALHKEGHGTFYVLYFFDEFSNDVEEMIWNPTFKEEEG